jgi:hypothetical protein
VAVSSHPTGVSILHRCQEKSSSTLFGPEDAVLQASWRFAADLPS